MYISFQSFNFTELFIRHANFVGELTSVVSDLDKNDASFKIERGLGDTKLVSFRSLNFNSYYLRHQNFEIKLHENVGERFGGHEPDNQFLADATFIWRPGNADSTASSFESLNFPGRYIRHRNLHLYLESGDDDLFRKDSTFRIVPGFAQPTSPIIG
ncbi:AbfB domain-containing protein [Pseudomonas chlororaphis]|uniref:AbfB domain-containing protein n=1 Tax=Pseudomonas chlororaphis TaxID=587753 RepID=UPI001CF1B16F|nr:AbfB domain-containing protein [Pseudomonas chlororaphis]UCR86207.1 AbfB domain-containing protein [Pseudomonas chlororaphis]